MVVFPNAKINLGLHVLGKRADGYHDLATVFYPIPLFDTLEVVLRKDSGNSKINTRLPVKKFRLESGSEIRFSFSGLEIAGEPESNLCIKACVLFDKKFRLSDNLDIHLHKIIPMGAGLGGGSSDGAFMLKLLNEISGSPLSNSVMMELASRLGSDCAFFIRHEPSFAQGRGELLEPVNLFLGDKYIVVVFPGIMVPTASAFEGIGYNLHPADLKQVIAKPVSEWMYYLENDFEKKIFEIYPEIAQIKMELLRQGAVYAAMSGSGSAVYGIFETAVNLKLQFPGYHQLKQNDKNQSLELYYRN